MFPNGIVRLDNGGRAWWPLDINDLITKIMQGDYNSVFHRRPTGIEQARETLMKVISEVKEELHLPMSKFVIGGFSQGAMLSTDVCLHLEENPAYLVVMSGMLVAKEDWEKLAPNKKVFIIFGFSSLGTESFSKSRNCRYVASFDHGINTQEIF